MDKARVRWIDLAMLALVTLGGSALSAAPASWVRTEVGSTEISWSSQKAGVGMVLTVSGPESFYLRQDFAPGQAAVFSVFDAAGQLRPVGTYVWEIRAVHRLDEAARQELEAIRQSGDEGALLKSGKLPAGRGYEWGSFSIREGRVVAGQLDESESPSAGREIAPKGATLAPRAVHTEGVCLGFDCPASPAFGDSTILLMENNTRMKFGDTSVSPFPNNDWEIEANSSVSGGLSYLGFNDCGTADNDGGCATDLVFAVEAGARQNSLYVEGDGDVGVGTANPVLDLHIVTGNTPALRLEQDGSSGFTAQTWDLAGNETNFFVRDVTSGSLLPFRIRPGAAGSSVDINASGVGILTGSPDTELTVQSGATNSDVVKVRRSGSTDQLFGVFEASTGEGVFRIFDAANTENIRLTGQAQGRVAIGCASGLAADLTLNAAGGGACGSGTESTINAGATQFTITSSRAIKKNLQPVEAPDILDKIRAIGVYTYDFIGGPEDRIGLMAEDFHRVFQRGSDKLLDGQEVEMAMWLAIQQLIAGNEELTRRSEELALQNESMAQELEELKSRLE